LVIQSGVSGTIYRNNAMFGNGTDTVSNSGSGTSQSNNLIGTNPQWTNAASGDFTIPTTSPCKDAGITAPEYTTDAIGTPRPFGPSYDIGPYEFFTNVYSYVPSFLPQIHLQWTASPELDIAYYKLYYGTATGVYGTPVNVGNTTTYLFTGLTSGTRYFLALSAVDTSGNESAKSTEITGSVGTPLILSGTVVGTKVSHKVYLPSGAVFTLGGSALHSRRRVYLPLGSALILSGTGAGSFQSGGKFFYTGTGTFVLGGTSPLARKRIYIPVQDPLTLSGSAPHILSSTNTHYSYAPFGGLVIGGTAPVSRNRFFTPSTGSMILGGSAPASKILSSLQSFNYIGSGAFVLGGSAPVVTRQAVLPTGPTFILGGAAPTTRSFAVGSHNFVYTPSDGSFILGGSSPLVAALHYTPDLVDPESFILGGSAPTLFDPVPETPFTCNPFRLFQRDCEVSVRGWGSDSPYSLHQPFGGKSHQEPSGAEI